VARRQLIGLFVLLAGLSIVPVAMAEAGASRGLASANRLESHLLDEINVARKAHSLRPLRLNQALGAAAQEHSFDMVVRGFFDHALDGGSPADRVGRFYSATGFRMWVVGENLLWASPTVNARRAVRAWLRSPGHRANLLAPRWREVGIAAVRADSAPGYFQGREVTVLTVDFGARA